MNCRTIAQKINSILEKRNELDKKGNIISVTYKTVNNILKKYFVNLRRLEKYSICRKKIWKKGFNSAR